MKKVILIILTSVIGAALLLGGSVAGAYMYDMTIPHFDNYYIGDSSIYARIPDDPSFDYDAYKEELLAEGYHVRYPDFWYINNFTDDLIECYGEVEGALRDYAFYVAGHYNNRAVLDPEVECTDTRLTIKFTGYGVLEDGTKEDLARTYIFDIEGAGSHKLPKLLNKAEIFPELLGTAE